MESEMRPLKPSKSNKPVKYHCYDSCNKCGGVNDVSVTDATDAHTLECKKKCRDCGLGDYWAHGFFEYSQKIESEMQ